MTLLAPCSIGDLLDRITILRIKVRRSAPSQRPNVQRELERLCACWPRLEAGDEPEMAELSDVNLLLWEVEDQLRAAEAALRFDAEFVTRARSVYRLNDRRAALKRTINLRLGSELMEEKIHPVYP